MNAKLPTSPGEKKTESHTLYRNFSHPLLSFREIEVKEKARHQWENNVAHILSRTIKTRRSYLYLPVHSISPSWKRMSCVYASFEKKKWTHGEKE